MSYQDSLTEYKRVGASHADDPELMAGFCAHGIQILVGAVSPSLVWEGAQAKGLTTAALAELAVSSPMAVSDLQWEV